MKNLNDKNIFETAVTMQELEPRLELASASSDVEVTPTASYTTGDPSLTYNVTAKLTF
jgi:hypothetical protein